jgi:predicted RNA binding protein with dsRBD fold (UPF0201 family)
MEDITLRIETDIHPTESEEKVKKAVENLFGNIPMQTKQTHEGSVLTSETNGQEPLFKLRNTLANDHIRDAARKALFSGLRGNKIRFFLNKQVAFVGHVSFSEESAESPLGPIKVTIESDAPQQLIDWIAPKTQKNRI